MLFNHLKKNVLRSYFLGAIQRTILRDKYFIQADQVCGYFSVQTELTSKVSKCSVHPTSIP